MRRLLPLLAVAAITLAIGFFLGRRTALHEYRLGRDLVMTGPGAASLTMPSGAVLLSKTKLTKTPDVGWVACVPVKFDSLWDAVDLGVVESTSPLSGPDVLLQMHTSLQGVKPPAPANPGNS